MSKVRSFLIVALAALTVSGLAFADHGRRDRRDVTPSVVLEHVRDVARLAARNIFSLNEYQLRALNELLYQAEDILNGQSPDPNYPSYPVQACTNEPVEVFQATFIKVKNWAYSPSGLNKNSQEATEYAQHWTQTHACNEAESFIQEMGRLRNWAYSPSGLNKNSAEAAAYALKTIINLCGLSQPYEAEFTKLYNFAYSPSGLNMNSEQARAYALPQIEQRFFSCYGRIFRAN